MTATWCEIDENGRVTGPVKITYNDPWPCRNGYASGFHVPASGVALHTEDGYEAGTISWFNNPAAEASSTFAVGEDGAVWQFGPVSGHGWASWAQADGNLVFYSIEDADNTNPATPFTAPQLAAIALLVEVLSDHDGFPLAVATNPATQRGVTLHSEGGVAWGNHPSCPGTVRASQRPAIITAAKTIRAQREAPILTYATVTADGTQTLAQIAATHKTAPAGILRCTAVQDKLYPAPVATWLNGVFGAMISPLAPVPKGIVLRVPLP